MAVRLALLIGVLTAVMAMPADGARSTCLSCHPQHHAALGSCGSCHRGNDTTRRLNLAHLDLVPGRLVSYRLPGDPAVARGKKTLERAACRRCHVSHGKGNRLATNLDRLADRHPLQLLTAISRPVSFMPDFKFAETSIADLVNAILAGTRDDTVTASNAPLVVRFTAAAPFRENVFEKRCGGCHKVLASRYGGLGRGTAGPNLSGLFSDFYPPTFGRGVPWNRQRLARWLKNPRDIRMHALMQPVSLSDAELRLLVETLQVSSAR